MEIRKELAQKIIGWRMKAGLSIEQAAQTAEIDLFDLESYESGSVGIPLFNLAKIVEAYGVDPFEILALMSPQD